MKRKRKEELTPEQLAAYITQCIDRLANGQLAPAWVCLELLDLTGDCSEEDIYRVLHRALHVQGGDEGSTLLWLKRAKIQAGAYVLKLKTFRPK